MSLFLRHGRSTSTDSGSWVGFVLLALIALLAIELAYAHVLETTELRLFDTFLRHHAPEYRPDPDIVVIDIDDASMSDMQDIAGLWAWPREVHADLLEALSEFQPRAVVFDIAFSEADRKRPKSDAALSTAMQPMSVYLPATRLPDDTHVRDVRLADVAQAFAVKQRGIAGAKATMQLPEAVNPKQWKLGLINAVDDADGVLRRYRTFLDVYGWRLPSLPARVVGDLGMPLPAEETFTLRWAQGGRKHLSYGRLYRLLTEGRASLSAQDLASIDASLRGKILVIGSSATSAFDHHVSPLGSRYVGVDILALAIDNLKNQHTVTRVSPIWVFLGGVLMLLIQMGLSRTRSHLVILGVGMLAISTLAIVYADWAVAHDHFLPVVTPLAFAWAFYIIIGVTAYLRERRKRGRAVALFQRFLNPAVVEGLVDRGETVESLSGQTREITVLFSDIRGFTTLSESRKPQEIVDILNRYFDRQVEVVFRHGGTLDKFIGDCIMAFWGAPTDDPLQARHAVAAALEMQQVLLDFKQELLAEDASLGDFDIGIGVHTGPAVVGFIGAERKLDYTAIGDTVNLASRVEGLTKGVARILVTAETQAACGECDDIDFTACGAFAVKGRHTEVALFAPTRKET